MTSGFIISEIANWSLGSPVSSSYRAADSESINRNTG
jgi:hypothetical protein